MRTRLPTRLPSVLALTLASLLLVPLTALAQSGAPAISMYPETAGPGSTVEVTGIDFPPERVVEVQVMTPDGTVPLTTATTSPEGAFRQIVALPIGAPDGAWELQATAADGTTSTFAFVTAADVAAVADLPADVTPTEAGAGNSGGDIALMLIVGVLLGIVAFAAMVVYRQVKDESPPGMGKGDDLIWGGGQAADGPAQTATEEPYWKAAEAAGATRTES
jgi:hypothetical protein